ncbi:MAG: translation elongation factor Ts [Kiritimatiellae bacterium]|nr:translation elongation factor Ts [Kiritimatiellia bacterium]
MAQITAADVNKLRQMTGVSMMECKKALTETDGDVDAAVKILRERGVAVAAKRAEKEVKQGVIAAKASADGNTIAMVEVNCETDFVAKNADFVAFVDTVAQAALDNDKDVAEVMADDLSAFISKTGENVKIRRSEKFSVAGTGKVASYIHMGGKVGVLLEVACGKAETLENAEFVEMVKDITLQIAAVAPKWLDRSVVPEADIAAEREIYAKQMEGQNKPANILEKIIDGKINKFFTENCLVDQVFVKDGELTITKLIAKVAKACGDEIKIVRYTRYQLGA